ncbi:hypothetical protein QTI66_00160 [Variovorax sp. J22R133]|uniref:hypothetical protein n=1 Tax=Variovorax brevis TaxID=3053503 RepID=UPI00257879DE|nr:hypothetical protein [Variovorax sp. J22R133]MDM0110540.1 hypothetical protein [Variovorax sp. J22R133]
MKSILVHLNYSSTDSSPSSQRQTELALPLRVLDADGSLVAEGAASTSAPASFDISALDGPAFVRLIWPSGRTQTKRVEVAEGGTGVVSFDDSRLSSSEWSSWAVPRLTEHTSLASPDLPPSVHIEKFDRVWLQIWVFEDMMWRPTFIQPRQTYRNDSARQLDFELDEKCRLLQLGGTSVPWRFVALPGGGTCRVFLTPREPNDLRSEPLKVVVSTFRRDAETLLEFLARDSLRAANAVGSYQPVAQRLMQDKTDDPVSAVAAAYFLLRTERWRAIPLSWFDNLYNLFPWLADPAVIRCALLLRRGLLEESDVNEAAFLLKTCLERGVPVFSEGLLLLQETASVLQSARGPCEPSVYQQVERLVASQAWAGAALSFYGESPSRPSPDRIVGLPGKGRSVAVKPTPNLKAWSSAPEWYDKDLMSSNVMFLGDLS